MSQPFQLENSFSFQGSNQQNIMESLIISQNCNSNVFINQDKQEKKDFNNMFDFKGSSEANIEFVTENQVLNVTKNQTQVVEEEDYHRPTTVLQSNLQDKLDQKQYNDLGDPEIIDNSTFVTKILKCIQLKLKQDYSQQEKMNLPDQIYESDGTEEVKVGRSKLSNKIVISDELSSISSNHASFYWNKEKQSWYLSDNDSKNGSFLVIDNSPVKPKDRIAIGLFSCTIDYSIKFMITDFVLTFKCMVDDSIEPFQITKSVPFEEKLMIGKLHQSLLKDDPMIANNQCYIQFQKNKIKIWNCLEADYKIAKIIQHGKSVKVKDQDIIRFGLVNYYIFSQFVKKIESKQSRMLKCINTENKMDSISSISSSTEGEECCICYMASKKICILNPCNHSRICIHCVIKLMESKKNCPICQCQFKDFKYKE
ncbi:hypothetical protein ABPG72_022644 [Tetrahymena utriculariae]